MTTIKAYQIIAAGRVRKLVGEGYRAAVRSSNGIDEYIVDLRGSTGTCSCPDCKYRRHGEPCKHVLAVQELDRMEHELGRFLHDRPDIDRDRIASKASSQYREKWGNVYNPTEQLRRAKMAAWYYVAAGRPLDLYDIDQPAPEPAPTPARHGIAAAFALRFWWPSSDSSSAENAVLDDTAEEPREIQVRTPSAPEWHAPAMPWREMQEWISTHGYVPSAATLQPQSDHGRSGLYVVDLVPDGAIIKQGGR